MRIFINSLFIFGLIISGCVWAYPSATDSTIVVEEEAVVTEDKKIPWEDHTMEAFGVDVEKADGLLEPGPKPMVEGVSSQDVALDEMSLQDIALDADDKTEEENADGLTFEEISKRLMALEQKDKALSGHIIQLEERISELEEAGSVADKSNVKSLYGKFYVYMDDIKEHLGPKLFFVTIASVIIAFLALLIYLIIPRRREVSNVSYPRDTMPSGTNATFVDDGEEGVEHPESKLNLARAYMDMGEIDKAKPMLIDVLSHGTDGDQEEAKKLLDQIKYGDD